MKKTTQEPDYESDKERGEETLKRFRESRDVQSPKVSVKSRDLEEIVETNSDSERETYAARKARLAAKKTILTPEKRIGLEKRDRAGSIKSPMFGRERTVSPESSIQRPLNSLALNALAGNSPTRTGAGNTLVTPGKGDGPHDDPHRYVSFA
jgi:hypothetical protein